MTSIKKLLQCPHMSNSIIETLSRSGVRRERLSPLRTMSQLSAVRDLVKVTHQQLVANQIDRDASSYWPERQHRFDAFFYVPKINGVIMISSVGLPDAQDSGGLFLDIDYRNDEGEIKKLVGIQTVKVPEAVEELEALWLSGYLPRQLLQIAEIVRTASPISKEAYGSYFQKPEVPSTVTFYV